MRVDRPASQGTGAPRREPHTARHELRAQKKRQKALVRLRLNRAVNPEPWIAPGQNLRYSHPFSLSRIEVRRSVRGMPRRAEAYSPASLTLPL